MKTIKTKGEYRIVHMRPETLKLIKAIYRHEKSLLKKDAPPKVDIIHRAIEAEYIKLNIN